MMLDRHTVRPTRSVMVKLLPKVMERLSPHQVLRATALVATQKVPSGFLDHVLSNWKGQKVSIMTFPEEVAHVVSLLGKFTERDPSILNVLIYVARELHEHVGTMGSTEALKIFCALAEAKGRLAFRPLGADHLADLVHQLGSGLGLVGFGDTRGTDSSRDAADFLCALQLCGYQDVSTLSRHLADHVEDLDVPRLVSIASSLVRGDPSDDDSFVLLHAIGRRCTELVSDIDGQSLALLFQAFARHELYDEAFLEAATERMRVVVGDMTCGQIADTINAFNNLQLKEGESLDVLCNALHPQTARLSEIDIVRSLKGLVRLRHRHDELLTSFEHVIEKQKWSFSCVTLSNLVSVVSFFGTSNINGLMKLVVQRVQRLPSMSLKHVLTAFCRLQGRMDREEMREPLDKICVHLASEHVASSINSQQALALLACLARLQHNHKEAVEVLLTKLVGGVEPGFDEERCLAVIRSFDTSQAVEVLLSLHRLEVHDTLALQLVAVLRRVLLPQLHDLRAREVTGVGRALAAFDLPAMVTDDGVEHDDWKEDVVRSCIENLRRHEHFLEANWPFLLPFKLMCMEIDAGVCGCRRLSEILNPQLLSFAERLRGLSREECEANRVEKLSDEEREDREEESFSSPMVVDFKRFRLSTGGYVNHFAADLLIEPAPAKEIIQKNYENSQEKSAKRIA